MSANPKAKSFNWFHFLKKPAEKIKSKDMEIAATKACSWITCACGQLCKVLPRHEDGEPEDDVLYNLGIRFYGKIDYAELAHDNNDFKKADQCLKEAKEILEKIEKRTIKLLTKK